MVRLVETSSGLVALGIVVLAATLAYVLSRALRLPPTPVFILTGILSRPVVVATGTGSDPALETVVFLALALLLFSAGAHLHPARFPRAARPRIAVFTCAGIMLVAVPAAAAVALLGWAPSAIPYAAAAVAFSSTIVALDLPARRGEVAESHGRLLVGFVLAQDALALLLFALLPNLPHAPFVAAAELVGILGLAVLAYGVGRVLARPGVWRRIPRAETRALVAFGLAFAFILLAMSLRIPIVAGAFLAGLAVAGFPANVHARPAVRASREFFAPLFFVTLGAIFPFPDLADALDVLALGALVLLVKPIALAFLARSLGFTVATSAETAVLAAHASEFALVLAATGFVAGHLDADAFGILGLVIAATMLVGSTLPRGTSRILARLLPRKHPVTFEPSTPHAVVLGAGTTGRTVALALHARGYEAVAVDASPHALGDVGRDVPTLEGDATDPNVLDAARVDSASVVIAMLTGDETTRAVMRAVRTRVRGSGALLVARAGTAEAAERLARLGVRAIQPLDEVARELERHLDAADDPAGDGDAGERAGGGGSW